MENRKNSKSLSLGAKGWGIILLAFASIYIFSVLESDSFNLMIPTFSAVTGMNQGVLYTFSTLAVVIGAFGAMMWGKFSKKYSARLAWAVSLVVAAVFCLIWSHASNYVVYFIAIALTEVGCMGFAYIASLNVISNWFPKKRGIAMGIVTIAYPFSASTTTLLCSKMVAAAGIAGVYYYGAVVCVILAILVGVFVRDYPEQKGAYPDNNRDFDHEAMMKEYELGLEYMKTSEWTGKKLMRTGRVWMVIISLGIMCLLASGVMTNFLNKFMEAGYTMEQIIQMLAIAGLIAIPASFFIGFLDTKIGTRKAAIITYICCILAIGFNLAHIPVLTYISLPLLGLMLGGSANFVVSTTTAIWGRYDFPNAYKVIQPICSLIGGVGIMLVGIIGTSVSYFTAYVVLFILAIIGFIVFVCLKWDLLGRN